MSLKHNDLEGTILSHITLDEFEPKSGDNDEVVVLGFYAVDQEPAKDLNTFIQRGTIDVIDTEVSPNPDQNGNYVVFVEMRRDDEFPILVRDLLTDVDNLVGAGEWFATMSNSPEKLAIDETLLKKVSDRIPDTKEVTDGDDKAEIKVEEGMFMTVDEVISESTLTNLHIDGESVILEQHVRKIGGNVVGVGDHDSLMEGLQDAEIDLSYTPIEVSYLRSMLGEAFEVWKMGSCVVINNTATNKTVLLSETQIING